MGLNRHSYRGLSLAEVLVASGLSLLVLLVLAKTMSNLNKAKAVQDETSKQARDARTLDSKLRALTGTSSSDGLFLSNDGRVLSIQPISRLDSDDKQQWAPEAHVVVYDSSEKSLILKTVPFASAGISSTSLTPVSLTEENMVALKNTDGDMIAKYPKIIAMDVQLDRDQASLGLTLQRETLYSKVYQDAPWLKTGYSLRSSLPISDP